MKYRDQPAESTQLVCHNPACHKIIDPLEYDVMYSSRCREIYHFSRDKNCGTYAHSHKIRQGDSKGTGILEVITRSEALLLKRSGKIKPVPSE